MDVAAHCPSCAKKMASLNIRQVRASVFFGTDFVKTAKPWSSLPKGWTEESLENFWNSLTGDVKHKVTKCIKEMKGKLDDPGAFCASARDRIEGKGWRSEASVEVARRYLSADEDSDLKILKRLRQGDKLKVEAKGLGRPRILEVTSVDKSGSNIDVYTSSGKTRPGHLKGGLLTYRPNTYGTQIMYQPTPLQQIVEVTNLRKV